MRKLLLVLALAASAFSAPAFAADWVYVTGSSASDLYVDDASISQTGAYKQAVERMVLLDLSSEVESIMATVEYDCSERRKRILQFTEYYYPDGSETFPGSEVFEYVVPGSVEEAGLDYVCFGRLPQ